MIKEGFNNYKNCTILYTHKKKMIYTKGSFHPKLWILKFKDSLRIVVGSANLYLGDWSVWSNCLWIHDFPLKKIEEKNKKFKVNKKYQNLN